MYCLKCGKKIDDDSVFCGYCGSPIIEHPIDEEAVKKENSTEDLESVSECESINKDVHADGQDEIQHEEIVLSGEDAKLDGDLIEIVGLLDVEKSCFDAYRKQIVMSENGVGNQDTNYENSDDQKKSKMGDRVRNMLIGCLIFLVVGYVLPYIARYDYAHHFVISETVAKQNDTGIEVYGGELSDLGECYYIFYFENGIVTKLIFQGTIDYSLVFKNPDMIKGQEEILMKSIEDEYYKEMPWFKDDGFVSVSSQINGNKGDICIVFDDLDNEENLSLVIENGFLPEDGKNEDGQFSIEYVRGFSGLIDPAQYETLGIHIDGIATEGE